MTDCFLHAVIDISGSMGEVDSTGVTFIQKVKCDFARIIDLQKLETVVKPTETNPGRQCFFSLTTFNNEVHKLISDAPISDIDINEVFPSETSGGTALFAAVSTVLAEVYAKPPEASKVVVILTDGMNNEQPMKRFEACNLYEDASKNNTTIFFLGSNSSILEYAKSSGLRGNAGQQFTFIENDIGVMPPRLVRGITDSLQTGVIQDEQSVPVLTPEPHYSDPTVIPDTQVIPDDEEEELPPPPKMARTFSDTTFLQTASIMLNETP